MRFKIPLTQYEVHINKRGLKWVKNGELVKFVDWVQGITFTQSTPILEQIYDTIASEYAKLDYSHVIDKNGDFNFMGRLIDSIEDQELTGILKQVISKAEAKEI